jgi:hypothetical protein
LLLLDISAWFPFRIEIALKAIAVVTVQGLVLGTYVNCLALSALFFVNTFILKTERKGLCFWNPELDTAKKGGDP